MFHTYRFYVVIETGKIIRSQHGDRGGHVILKTYGAFLKGQNVPCQNLQPSKSSSHKIIQNELLIQSLVCVSIRGVFISCLI